MKIHISIKVSFALCALIVPITAVTCPALTAEYSNPILSDGWEAKLIVNDLTEPRGILFDNRGGLLVVQQNVGIVHFQFDDGGGTCLEVKKKTFLVNSTSVCFLYTL